VLYAFPWGEKGTELENYKHPEKWQTKLLCDVRDKLKSGEIDVVEAAKMVIKAATVSGHGIGKSAMVSWIILWALCTMVDTRGVVTANTDTQLKTKTWSELAKWHRLCICSHWFTYTATSIYSNDPDREKTWRVDAIPWSITNTEAFAGLHNQGKRILIIFDEASAIHDKIWEVAEGATTDKDTQILWFAFGNGTRNSGTFRECFRKLRDYWMTYSVDSREVSFTNKEEIQKLIDIYGIDSDRVKVRVRGMFPSASAKQFIPTEFVDRAFGKHLRPEQYDFAPVILTLDPAWEGDDDLIIGKRQGFAFTILRKMPKNDNDILVANILANYEDEFHADAVFIDGGYGTGIFSGGKTMGREWTLVWFSGESSDPGCCNKRAEMWNLTKKWLSEGGAIPKDQELYDDLIGPETVPRLDGKIQLESKKDMKERGLHSPNKGDSLALSFAFPVVKKSRTNADLSNFKAQEYNPWKDDD
jgi:hypothetical protein